MLFRFVTLFVVVLGAANAFPTNSEIEESLPIGNPAGIFTNLFYKLSKVVIDNLSTNQNEDSQVMEDLENQEKSLDTETNLISELEKKNLKLSDTLTMLNDTVMNDTKLVIEDLDTELKSLEEDIERNLNLSVFDSDLNSKARDKFKNDYESLKSQFVEKLKSFEKVLIDYAQKIYTEVTQVVEKKSHRCDGDDCVYDLDESVSSQDMNVKVRFFEENILRSLNSTLFAHHKFHRSRSHFIHEYKKAKHRYMMQLRKISNEIDTFTKKANSKNRADKEVVNREEDGFLYRNENSLF